MTKKKVFILNQINKSYVNIIKKKKKHNKSYINILKT